MCSSAVETRFFSVGLAARASLADRRALLLPTPAVICPEHASQVIDFAGVVEIVTDHGGDDPPRRPQLAPVRHARRVEVLVGQRSDVLHQTLMRFAKPAKS